MQQAAACAAGKYSDVEGATSNNTCQDCLPGEYSLANATSCTLCAAGTYSSQKASSQCSVCAHVYFSLPGATTCENCSVGEEVSITANFDIFNKTYGCVKCPVGKFGLIVTEQILLPNPNYIRLFTAAMYDRVSRLNVEAGCKSPLSTGDWKSKNCRSVLDYLIEQGYWLKDETDVVLSDDYFTFAACQRCPEGTIALVEGAVSEEVCVYCAAGKYAKHTQVCIDCPADYWSRTGNIGRFCSQCNLGTYTNGTVGATDCWTCPQGTEAVNWFDRHSSS